MLHQAQQLARIGRPGQPALPPLRARAIGHRQFTDRSNSSACGHSVAARERQLLQQQRQRRGGVAPPPHAASASADGFAADAGQPDTTVASTFALTKVILGAGMTAIPRAYFQMGILAGTAMIVAVGMLTYWTKAVLVNGAAVTNTKTYSSLAEAACGKAVAQLLQYAIFLLCFGFMIVFQVVIADILVGPEGAANGLLNELTGVREGIVANRKAIIASVCAFVCAPLMALRDMAKLAPFNAAGVTAVSLLAVCVAALGATTLATGAAYMVPITPNWAAFGNTPMRIATSLAAVVPVVLTCYVAHHSVHPIMPMLKPYSAQRMNTVVAWAIAASGAVFLMLGLGGALTFGPHLDFNLLTNLSQKQLTPIVGEQIAGVMNLSVRGGFLISLIGSFVMFMFPLRTCMAELLWGRADAPAKEKQHYYLLTYGTLSALLVLAVLVPNIWAALSFVGNVASTLGAFIIPALISLSLGDKLLPSDASGFAKAANKVTSYFVLVLGVALFANGMLSNVA